MNSKLLMRWILGSICLVLVFQTGRLMAQINPNYEDKFIEISLPDSNFILRYVNVLNTEGLTFLASQMKNNEKNFPMMLIIQKKALPLKKALEMYDSVKPEQKKADNYTTEIIKICAQKDSLWRGLDSIQNMRIMYLKQTNTDLMGINKTLSEEYKGAIATAREANKGWSWQGLKDIILGTAAGLAIGLLIGLTR
jgi:hypothetical protein